MTAAAFVLAGLLAQSSLPSAPVDVVAAEPARAAAQSSTPADDGPSAPSEPAHQVGVGATVGLGTRSNGAGFRYFFNDRVGMNANVNWLSAPPFSASQQSGRLLIAPSAVFMLTKSKQYASVDVRPYIGGGLNYATGSVPIAVAGTTTTRLNGFGMQAFGGVELTFQDARNFAISAEVVHYEIAGSALSDGLGQGTNLYVLLHYYMR